jgi:hypothetical protein
MHAGFSFSYSPISVLLRQPLSIKKELRRSCTDHNILNVSSYFTLYSE